jgi:hypothetical protein
MSSNLNGLVLQKFSSKYEKNGKSIKITDNEYGTPYYRIWADIYDNGVDTVLFPDNFSKDNKYLPRGIKTVYLGKNFTGVISEKHLPQGLVVYYTGTHPVVSKKDSAKEITYISSSNPESSTQTNTVSTANSPTQTNRQYTVNSETQTTDFNFSDYSPSDASNPKYKAEQILKKKGINAKFDKDKKKLTVEIINTNPSDASDFYEKVKFISNKRHTDKLILIDIHGIVKEFPKDFKYGPDTKSVALYLNGFNSNLPLFNSKCQKIDLNLPALQTQLPELPSKVEIFRFISREYNHPLVQFPDSLHVLHLRLKHFNNAIPEYPGDLLELTLELQEYRQRYPILPDKLKKFHLTNLREVKQKPRNINTEGNVIETQKLESFGKPITYFPESLVDIKLPAYYKYPLPEIFLDRILKEQQDGVGVLQGIHIYGSDNKGTIIISSKNKFVKIMEEISLEEKTEVDARITIYTEEQQKIYEKYKEILEMYLHISVSPEQFLISFTNDLNTKYVDYSVFSLLQYPLFRFDYELFNMDLDYFINASAIYITTKSFDKKLPDFKNISRLVINSNKFNQPIPESVADTLELLNIISDIFNQPIPYLSKLNILDIRSPRFNHPVDPFIHLEHLIIISNDFDQQIAYFTALKKLFVESKEFNQYIPYIQSLEELDIRSPKFNRDIPSMPNLILLEIRSDAYDMPIQLFENLTGLYIYSNVFNQTIPPYLDKLITLEIGSKEFNQEIPKLPNLKHLKIVSEKFNKDISHLRTQLDKLEI